jgi:hypothetical protein
VEVTAHVAEPDASLTANESDVTAVDAASDADIATAGMAAVRAVASVLRAVHEQQTAEAEAKREAAEAARSRGGNVLGSLFQRALPRARRGGANALRRWWSGTCVAVVLRSGTAAGPAMYNDNKTQIVDFWGSSGVRVRVRAARAEITTLCERAHHNASMTIQTVIRVCKTCHAFFR